MGLCSSKSSARTSKVALVLPPTVSANQKERNVVLNVVETMYMDRDVEVSMTKSDDEKSLQNGDFEGTKAKVKVVECEADNVLLRSPDSVVNKFLINGSRRNVCYNADDLPISSTYHRVHSVEMAEQEEKWRRELKLEKAQREEEVREYKKTLQIAQGRSGIRIGLVAALVQHPLVVTTALMTKDPTLLLSNERPRGSFFHLNVIN
ncbi:hypothetical protein Plhal304r1_c035g0108851 [Plasmopara halstedii]